MATREATYAQEPTWHAEQPRIRAPHLVLQWIVSAIALLVATWIVPGADVSELLERPDRRRGDLAAERDPAPAGRRTPAAVYADHRVPRRARAGRSDADGGRQHHRRRPARLVLRGCAAGRARRVRGQPGDRDRRRRRRRQRVLVPRHPARRPPERGAAEVRPARHHLPRDRRPRAAHPAPGDARRQRPQHGPVDGRGRLHAVRLGDRPLIPDGRQPGRHPARLERGHPRLPLGREGDGKADDVLRAGRLRGDRAPPHQRQGPAPRRRRQPGQPVVGRGRRGDPDGQPDQCREGRQPRLPGVLRQRVQRHPGAGAVRLGADPGVGCQPAVDPSRRAAARPPRRRRIRSSAPGCASSSAT